MEPTTCSWVQTAKFGYRWHRIKPSMSMGAEVGFGGERELLQNMPVAIFQVPEFLGNNVR